MEKGEPFAFAVPDDLGIPHDPLRCQINFYNQATELKIFQGDTIKTKMVSAADVAFALATNLSFGTGLLPTDTLWWRNTRRGPLYALYVEPRIWKLALQKNANKPPSRFTVPMPGLIFLCIPSQAPWVFAVVKKPTKETDRVFHAPLCNLSETGRSCAGDHKYPARVADMVQSFFISFFTSSSHLANRSKRFPDNIAHLWKFLDNKKRFPMADLVQFATIKDIMNLEMD